jgi:hypothetical protein
VRNSIKATYDSRKTGPQYHVTTRVNARTVSFQHPIADPFVSTTVTVGFRDVVRALAQRRRVEVEVLVGGTRDRVDDVLELDDNTLIPNSTRKAAFHSHIGERLGSL